jgi:hypothetical protein
MMNFVATKKGQGIISSGLARSSLQRFDDASGAAGITCLGKPSWRV